MAKISVIQINQIQMVDNTIEMTASGLAVGRTQREVNNDDLVVRITVDKELDKNARIIVPDTHVAFISKDGRILETLEGGIYPIYDKKRDLSRSFVFFKNNIRESVQIFYIAKTKKQRMLWGTNPRLKMIDPVTELPVEVAANGELWFRIGDPRKFYYDVVALDSAFDIDKLHGNILASILVTLKPTLASIMEDKQLTFYNIERHLPDITEAVTPSIAKVFEKDFGGLELCKFLIVEVCVPPETEALIKKELANRKSKKEQKQDLKEILTEIERLEDKEWDKQKYMAELEQRDRDRYFEVCKIIGWEGKGKGGKFCPRCGESATGDFCGNCGNSLKPTKKICPKCNKENASSSKFCNGCGEKI